MILQDRYDGREAPFEGDRELVLRHLPADARILAARATVTPIDFTGGRDPFVETLLFGNTGDWGATKTRATGAVEVDLHARRILAGIQGSGLANAAMLQIDLGGAFAAVDPVQGTLLPPGATTPTLQNDSVLLPGFTTSRFRLTPAGDVTAVRVRSVPANVSLALRGRPTFWFQPGELTAPKTTPDWSAVLAAFLPQAEVRDGFFLIPFVLHADGISRLAVELEIEYLRSTSVLPAGLREAKLPFELGSLPTGSTALKVSLPAGSVLAPGASLGRALGAFQETRVAWGPTGEVTAATAVAIPQGASLAQPVKLKTAVEAVAVDLLVAHGKGAARLQINLLEDLDGKPGGGSLWPAPVPFGLDPGTAGAAAWVSVPLPAPFRIAEQKTVWLAVQSLEGDAAWSAVTGAADLPNLQRTTDGGLSWRQAASGPPLATLFRLRDRPADFRMPIELQVGAGSAARRVSLQRFNPLQRVELPFALPEIEDAFNRHLAEAGPGGCPRGEHLANGGFADWVRVGNELGKPTFVELSPDAANPSPTGAAPSRVTVAVAASPDGRRAYTVEAVERDNAVLRAVDLACDHVDGESLDLQPNELGGFLALAVHPAGTRAYALFDRGLQVVDLASWRLLVQAVRLPVKGRPSGCLAVSPDGGRLYLGFNVDPAAPPGFGKAGGNVVAVDTALLEEAALGSGADPWAAPTTLVQGLGSGRDPVALAVAAGGARLWVLTESELLPVETSRLRLLNPQSVVLGDGARFLSLSPDAATAIVSRLTAVDLVDLASRQISPLIVGTDCGPVAVEPDGGRAFVAVGGNLRVIDFGRRAAGDTITVGDSVSGVAVTPQGDRVLLSDGEADGLYLLTVGVPVPAKWAVLGPVAPLCAGEPRRRAVLLGEMSSKSEIPATNAVLVQVVPIAPGCPYELTFDGLATDGSAVAEVLWRGPDCAAAGSAAVPIPVLDEQDRDEPDLRSTRLRLAPPAGATQAEVRFRAPLGAAAVAGASLKATDAVLANGDLRTSAPGAPEGWTTTPANAPGFSRRASGAAGDTIRLRNAGAQAVTLAQQVPAHPPDPFVLELRGRSTASTASRAAPALELRWLAADGSSPAPATVLDVPPESFDGLAASGAVPTGAAKAELRITVPPGASLDVASLALRFPARVDVPVTFVAEAPGELTLLDWRLAYEEHEVPLPAVPASGLCAPTTAGSAGGAGGEDDGCCCDEDGGGAGGRQPGAPVLAPALAVIPGRSRGLADLISLATPPSVQPVTSIPGIGRGRARALKAASMDSLEAVATSNPAVLRSLLRGVTEEAATRIIAAARDLLRG